MSKKLHVGSLSYDIDDNDLSGIFTKIGSVQSAKVIKDFQTNRSKGFGFVEMANEEDAKRAIRELNGSVQMGRAITVSEAKPDTKKSGGFGGGRGRTGGFGGGRGGFGGSRDNERGGFGGGGRGGFGGSHRGDR